MKIAHVGDGELYRHVVHPDDLALNDVAADDPPSNALSKEGGCRKQFPSEDRDTVSGSPRVHALHQFMFQQLGNFLETHRQTEVEQGLPGVSELIFARAATSRFRSASLPKSCGRQQIHVLLSRLNQYQKFLEFGLRFPDLRRLNSAPARRLSDRVAQAFLHAR